MTRLDDEIRAGLTSEAKRLPPVLFYDARGSALFEAITRLPEYYPTETEREILREHAREMLIEARGRSGELEIVELGAGTADKTRTLLHELLRLQERARYVPIDVSEAAIVPTARALEREHPGLAVQPIVARNREGLGALSWNGGPPRLVLFIGSSIGNYDPPDAARLLADVSGTVRDEDALLLGTDMRKDTATVEAAYNDAQGLTAAFNLNALAHLNREYGADFRLDRFAHRAFFNADQSRIEMHLVSLAPQRVRIPKLDLEVELREGETLHTENSYKYTLADVERLATEGGWRVDRSWWDAKRWFGVHLLRRTRA